MTKPTKPKRKRVWKGYALVCSCKKAHQLHVVRQTRVDVLKDKLPGEGKPIRVKVVEL